MVSRLMGLTSAILVGGAVFLASCSSSEPESTAEVAVPTGSSSPSATTTEVVNESEDASTPTESSVPGPTKPIPEGGFLIAPDGPFVDGQKVTLLADKSTSIDRFNSAPRLCARVDEADEICDPTWFRPTPLPSAPSGTQGIVIELPRTHFGPTGRRDCADSEVRCRLVWRTEAGELLMSEELTFDGRLEPETVVLEVAVGDTPGQVTVRATGADIGMPAEVVFSPAQMRQIATDVEFMADFDPDKLELSWQVGGLCGFGPGDPPIGSKSLENPPSWWAPTTLDPASDPALVRDFFGVSCDSFNDEKSGWPVGDESISRSLFRHIYGFGGWVDCAVTTCWLELGVTWTYPMPDGSTLGSDMPVARAIVDVEADWPSARPNIQILEPGPYSPGQDVTVEVTDHPLRSDGLGIGWCPGGDGYCRYHFSTYLDGVHRVTWRIPGESSDCGTNRCYFEVESQSEGLAPPAIVVVPIVGT